jgi:hypothetical protein
MPTTKSFLRAITIFLKVVVDITRKKMGKSSRITCNRMIIQCHCIWISNYFSPSFDDFDRALYTKDIEGTAPGTLISKVVKNKELA